MIEFNCPGCNRLFKIKDELGGRKAKCNKCGRALQIPPPCPKVTRPPNPKLPVRIRRLIADAEQIERIFSEGNLIQVHSSGGDPPELYQVSYAVRGIERLADEQPIYREEHQVEIQLTSDYPRLSPSCRMLTPIFHPNIDASSICVGDHWTAGERLSDLVIRIGEMIAYQAYNVKSPLNGEAAMWADLHPDQLPLDSRNLRPAEVGHDA